MGEKRIRALPGNDKCIDCNQPAPQWASVSYGTLVCLECSGQHRSLGVHLSFVRSVAMDSWTPKQIAAMEKSGGNAKLLEYFEARGINKSMKIATKYNTQQAAYYRERLSQELEGTCASLPDPGCYQQVTAVSSAVPSTHKSTSVVKGSNPTKTNCFDFDDDWGHESVQLPSVARRPAAASSTQSAKPKALVEASGVSDAKPNKVQLKATCASVAMRKHVPM